MRQCGKGEVEVIRQLAVLQFGRFREGIPDLLHVRGEGRFQVREWSGADVVTNHEE